MAISKKKLEAWNKVIEASKKVAEYRGLPFDEENCYFDGRDTVRKLEARAEYTLRLLDEPIPAPTEKQLSFLNILLDKPYNSGTKNAYLMRLVEDGEPNKYQVSALISKLKYGDDLIYGGYHVGSDDFERLDKEIEAIIALIK